MKPIMAAHSSAVPMRFCGDIVASIVRTASGRFCVIGVSMAPGKKQLTRMSVVAYSRPSDLVRAMTPAFEAHRMRSSAAIPSRVGGNGYNPPVVALHHARQHGTATQERAVQIDVQHILPLGQTDFDVGTMIAGTPAEVTSTSILPNAAMVAAWAACTDASDATSIRIPSVPWPSSAAAPSASLRDQITTCAPSRNHPLGNAPADPF